MVCFLFVVFRYADKDKYKIEVRKNEKAPIPTGIGAFCYGKLGRNESLKNHAEKNLNK